jgi:hypothetical protein
MNPDILHYLIEGVISAFLLFLAFRRAPGERARDNSASLKDYIETARMAGEEIRQEREKRQELERRLAIIEMKRYRIILDFEIGDPPTVHETKIIPIIPPIEEVQQPIRRGKK